MPNKARNNNTCVVHWDNENTGVNPLWLNARIAHTKEKRILLKSAIESHTQKKKARKAASAVANQPTVANQPAVVNQPTVVTQQLTTEDLPQEGVLPETARVGDAAPNTPPIEIRAAAAAAAAAFGTGSTHSQQLSQALSSLSGSGGTGDKS